MAGVNSSLRKRATSAVTHFDVQHAYRSRCPIRAAWRVGEEKCKEQVAEAVLVVAFGSPGSSGCPAPRQRLDLTSALTSSTKKIALQVLSPSKKPRSSASCSASRAVSRRRTPGSSRKQWSWRLRSSEQFLLFYLSSVRNDNHGNLIDFRLCNNRIRARKQS